MTIPFNRPNLGNILFYGLIITNIFMVTVLLQREQPVESDLSGFDEVCEILISASNYQYLSEDVPFNSGLATDSILSIVLQTNLLLVLRINETQCDICVVESIADFKEYLENNSPVKGAILASFSNNSDFEAFRLQNKGISVFNVPRINLRVEEINNPYLFVVDGSLKTRMVIVHQKEFPEKTKNYFEALTRFIELQ